jgi:hypothetical protein
MFQNGFFAGETCVNKMICLSLLRVEEFLKIRQGGKLGRKRMKMFTYIRVIGSFNAYGMC